VQSNKLIVDSNCPVLAEANSPESPGDITNHSCINSQPPSTTEFVGVVVGGVIGGIFLMIAIVTIIVVTATPIVKHLDSNAKDKKAHIIKNITLTNC